MYNALDNKRSLSGSSVVEKAVRYKLSQPAKKTTLQMRYFPWRECLYFLHTKYHICNKLRITAKYNNKYIDIYMRKGDTFV